MTEAEYRVVRFDPAADLAIGLSDFACGDPVYDAWLAEHAAASVRAEVCAVYLLLERSDEAVRVVGHYAINPTQIARADAPARMTRGWPTRVPAWKIGKLAVHTDLQSDKVAHWGRQLLRDALETIVRVSEVGGGKVIVVEAADESLLPFYERNGFRRTGIKGGRTLFLKVSTVRASLG